MLAPASVDEDCLQGSSGARENPDPKHVLWPGTIRASLILIVLIIAGAFYWNRRSPNT